MPAAMRAVSLALRNGGLEFGVKGFGVEALNFALSASQCWVSQDQGGGRDDVGLGGLSMQGLLTLCPLGIAA